MASYNNNNRPTTTTNLAEIRSLNELDKKIYTKEEIKNFRLDEAIREHPLIKKPTSARSKLAYKELMSNLKPTTKYLLPGQLVLFRYAHPKFKEELEYYDASPLTLFCGIIRTKDDTIREIGLNLHYYPPQIRTRILIHTYEAFRPYFEEYFNSPSRKPNMMISYDALKGIMKRNEKIAFGIKMYIPILRGTSYIVPTRLIPTASYTEGHFSKATLNQIFHFWRTF